MKRIALPILFVITILLGCSRVPLTGRRQAKMIPASQIQTMSYQNYTKFMSENRKTTDMNYERMVKNSGQRIKVAVMNYMNAHKKYKKRVVGYQWEFNTVESDQLNAWCMPGGKVCFYTGILPVCKNEEGVAVVMGHEIAHAIASHGNERMSHSMLAQGVGTGLGAFMQSKPAAAQQTFAKAFGIGSNVGVMLPFSRKHESEADKMGLMFMAMAGYDPRVAVDFWKRMDAMSKGQRPPEFVSTHPAPKTRVENLQKWMPEAMELYNKNKR